MYKNLFFIFILTILFGTSCAVEQKSANKNSINQVQNIAIPTSNLTDKYRAEMLAYINTVRVTGTTCSGPVPSLKWNNSLEAAASAHTKDMAINKFVAHLGSGKSTDVAIKASGMGSTFIDRIKYFGYPVNAGTLVGENVTRVDIKKTKSANFMKNFKRAMKIIYSDKEHCKILMDPRFVDVGANMYRNNDSYYFAVEFGSGKI